MYPDVNTYLESSRAMELWWTSVFASAFVVVVRTLLRTDIGSQALLAALSSAKHFPNDRREGKAGLERTLTRLCLH
jgi:hypothetical protein